MPDANIGLLTGRVSGLVVVDFDGGNPDADSILDMLGAESHGAIVNTGKGQHVYYRHPGGEIKNGVRIARVGDTFVDIRGDGGYVVAPPSIHETGARYSWFSGVPGYLPVLPEAFRRGALPMPTAAEPAKTDVQSLVHEVSEIDRLLKGVGSGERNNAAAKIAGYFLRVCHGNETAAWAAVCGWNERNRPGLGEYELRTTFNSIARRNRVTGEFNAPDSEFDRGGLEGATQGRRSSQLKGLSGAEWASAVRDAEPRSGVAAPSLPGLEEVGGIVPTDFLVLAGRPGMGKSTAAWGVVLDVCIRKHLETIIFSTEMTAAVVARWIASMHFNVPDADLTDVELDWLHEALSRAPVTMYDAGAVKVTDIIEIVQSRPETKLVIIDHLQRLIWNGEHRNQAIESGCALLKSLAKDTNCTVLALSQLNRSSAYEKRQPNLHDLRDSGGIEQEADAVCFLWSSAADPCQVELPVKFWWAKNRHGRLLERDAMFYKVTKRYVPTDACDRVLSASIQAQQIAQMNRMLGERDED
jgi:hypothetical protein